MQKEMMGILVSSRDCSSRSSSLRATPGSSRAMSLQNLRFVPGHSWTLPAVIKCMRLVIIEQGWFTDIQRNQRTFANPNNVAKWDAGIKLHLL